jgi:ribosomal protein S18 acetylase RimI-like enzyme
MIRPAGPADEPALRALDLATWTSLSSPAPRPPRDRPFELDGVLLAELADGIAGYVKLGPVLPLESARHVLEIKGLAVSPAHRRRGIGRALVQAAIREARAADASRLNLRVLAHNTDARAVYARCGFEVEGVLHGLFLLDGTYVDDVQLTLELTPPPTRATERWRRAPGAK